MTNKEVVQNFYQEFFNEHRIEAADKYIREDYIQHNPGVDQGREGLKSGFASKFQEDPTFHLEIQMMVEENDVVVVYHKKVDPDGKTKGRIVDIFRLVEGKLAEHWDVLQAVN